MDIDLSKQAPSPELTTSMLLALLRTYKHPRKKIHDLAKKGVLTPIKQGVYVLAQGTALRPYSKEILGNLIYGPSYVSLETALGRYGFIPERVEGITSICLGNSRRFSTSLGSFDYCHVKKEIYPHGIRLLEIFENAFCLYASPEKALLDFIYIREAKGRFVSAEEYFDYVVSSYRLDLPAIYDALSVKKFKALSKHYAQQRVSWFASELIERSRQ